MTNKVLKTINDYHMMSDCETLGIGLSGGADSVCLAHIMWANKEFLGIKNLKGIHIHHGIRGDEADRDLEFSRNFCEKLGIEFVVFYADVPAEAEKTGESIEECARRIRYSFFENSGCDKIATAHNLNDNMETFIFNLSRGASLSGLCGIPYVRDIYIRPLLDCSRKEIEEYIKTNNLDFVTDSTNLCDDYTRNKIRHNILPELFQLNPSFDNAFSRCVDSLNSVKSFVAESAENLIEKSRCDGYFDCSVFEPCHIALKMQIVSLILKEQNAKNISRDHINSVIYIMENGGSTSVGGNVKVNVCDKKLFFGEIEKTEYFEIPFSFDVSEFITPVGKYSVNIYDEKDLQNFNKQTMDNLIDCDKISFDAIVRNRRDGDSVQLCSRPNKTFKKLFNENKVSVYERDRMLVLSDEKGIVWTEFFGVAKRCKPDKYSKKIIKISKVGKNND
ncbi:MAG: tRNA lysidine(34) synthetase TilS [Clostridia bacterium]|nr:tRNA lysidine(34) synthetase TilS [Clostridia bacterium]